MFKLSYSPETFERNSSVQNKNSLNINDRYSNLAVMNKSCAYPIPIETDAKVNLKENDQMVFYIDFNID